MDIYGVMFSPFTARAVLAARLKGIKHKVSMPKDGNKSESFLKMNPLGKMPVLKDGSLAVFESMVIVEYLEAKTKKKRLLPAAAKAAVKIRQIGSLFTDYVQPAVSGLWAQLDPAKRDGALVDAKVADVVRYLDIVEKMIPAKAYIAGAKPTMADCYAVPSLFYVSTFLPRFGVSDPLAGRKKLGKYLARAKKDKILGKVLTEMAEGFQGWEKSVGR